MNASATSTHTLPLDASGAPVRFVVKTALQGQTRGAERTQVWNTSEPLGIGHPLRLVLEYTRHGVRVRTLHSPSPIVRDNSIALVPLSELSKGARIEIENFVISIKPVTTLEPVFAPVGLTGKEDASTQALTLFALFGNTVTSSTVIDDSMTVRSTLADHKPVFYVKRSNRNYTVTSLIAGVTINAKEVALNSAHEFTRDEFRSCTINHLGMQWKFGFLHMPSLPKSAVTSGDLPEANDERAFRRSLIATGAALVLLAIVSFFSKTETLELKEEMPAQMAKIIMQPRKKAPQSADSAPAQAVAQKAPEAVQKTAVVQAFRAKALQSAMSNLLKGGMTKLLAQSDLVAGTGKVARQMLDSKSSALAAAGPDAGKADPNVKIAALGGTAGVAGGVGYGQGTHANVKGQGGAFVSTDIGGLSVDEGLSRDEVGAVIHKHLSEIRYCYESALLRTPDVEGKLIVNFTIGGSPATAGNVKSSEIKSSTLPDPRLDDCIVRRLVTWKFPVPKGGIDVAVTYPFIFKSLGR